MCKTKTYEKVKQSQTEWQEFIRGTRCLYYRGGASGKFLLFDVSSRIVELGYYDGAVPSITDAEFTTESSELASVDLSFLEVVAHFKLKVERS